MHRSPTMTRRSARETANRTAPRCLRLERLERREMLTAIAGGQTVAGDIAVAGQTQQYTFTASANDWFDLTLSDANAASGFRPEITIFGPSGQKVVQGTTGANGSSTSVYYAVPPTGGGTYTAVVQDDGQGRVHTGAFDLAMSGDLLLTLAELDQNLYTGAIGAGGFTPIGGENTDPLNPGYAAAAFLSPDKTQVVIAFRGTVLTAGAANVEDVLADASFVTSIANPALAAMVSDAARFVAMIHSEYKGATITLTGHSLGGAEAQLVGAEAHLTTESFNAPGAAAVFSQLAPELAPVNGLGCSDLSIQYRIYGDQVSLAGCQFADTDTISVADPAGTTFDRLTSISPLLDLVVNASTYAKLHAIATVIAQITANAPLMPSNAAEPNDILPIEEALAALGLADTQASLSNSSSYYSQCVDAVFGA